MQVMVQRLKVDYHIAICKIFDFMLKFHFPKNCVVPVVLQTIADFECTF
jgi:hypothetical protein